MAEATAAGLTRNPKLRYSGMVVGRIGKCRLTWLEQEPILVTGGTRSGKGVGLIRPTLLSYAGPVVAYDGGKGEAFLETSGWRSTFSHVLNLDLTDPNGVHFNFLDEVRTEFLTRDVENLVQSIPKPERSDGHFEPAADSYIGAVIMHVLLAEPESEKNMSGVLRFISKGDEGARRIVLAASHPVAVDRATSLFGSSAEDVQNDEGMKYRQSVYNSARVRLKAFEEEFVAKVTSRSDFRLADLLVPGPDGRPVTLYLSTPASDDDRVRPVVSMFLSMLIQAVLANPKKTSDGRVKGKRLLMMIDEFPSLRMQILETAITKIVGCGATMFLGAQSLSALQQAPYGPNNQFRDNIRLSVHFAASDKMTQDAISQAIGTFDQRRTSKSYSQKAFDITGSRTRSRSDTNRLILDPGMVRMMADDEEVILVRGHPAILATKVQDYKDPILKKRLAMPCVPMRQADGTYPDLPYPTRSSPWAGKVISLTTIAPAEPEQPADTTKTAEPAPPKKPRAKKAFSTPTKVA
ncbi:type IV secretory system conjugative DNA transfer family protein (plasmid) [Skermanella sp. TT6]|uniref:Type IV secretory system conjugative DNA transfer family protein n=1 Tax=Skermanella cutis TaxID=2775420 RepID=A0ABX7BLK8_9PROT|nr:type IV secretory system conjugative DNA transfer family protein [Skermanella sp. TT6]QQP94069.1 type IV secretory system conjugative DNA transfer family protein [Skermanella sp. TT6]